VGRRRAVNIERRNIILAGHCCASWAVLSWPLTIVALSLLQFLPDRLSAWRAVREVPIPLLVYMIGLWPCVLGALAAGITVFWAATSRSLTPILEGAFALLSAAALYSAAGFVLTRFHAG
jgi:hypothetical protein